MNVPTSGEFALYLRKSRADLEAEARGEGETLAKHKKMLMNLAKRLKINITHIYQEVISGDRISDRPEVMKLLNDVEDGKWTGILVVEVERLARGDTMDQGMVAQAFKRSSTLIITPNKVYDPNNEFDEEYFEFGLFMARREYKTITRRLQRGRDASAQEGNYIGARPPYGYKLAWNERGERYLEPEPEQADVIKMIFDWYVNGLIGEDGQAIDMGGVKIARKLQEIAIPTYRRTSSWNFNVILQILRNEVYIGRIQWKKTSRRKSNSADKKYDYKAKDKEQWINVEGKHKPIIDVDTFNRAAMKLAENLSNPVKENYKAVNPLAGLIYCGKCSRAMVLKAFPKRRRPGYSLICNNKFCDCRSSNFDLIEDRIIEGIREWIKEYKLAVGKKKVKSTGINVYQQSLQTLRSELEQLEAQKGTLFDYLERKVYTEEVFLERSKNLSDRIKQTGERIVHTEEQLKAELNRNLASKEIIPTVEDALNRYMKSSDQQRKNSLIKSILSRVEYRKEKDQTGDQFEIELTMRRLQT